MVHMVQRGSKFVLVVCLIAGFCISLKSSDQPCYIESNLNNCDDYDVSCVDYGACENVNDDCPTGLTTFGADFYDVDGGYLFGSWGLTPPRKIFCGEYTNCVCSDEDGDPTNDNICFFHSWTRINKDVFRRALDDSVCNREETDNGGGDGGEGDGGGGDGGEGDGT